MVKAFKIRDKDTRPTRNEVALMSIVKNEHTQYIYSLFLFLTLNMYLIITDFERIFA